MSTNTVRYLSLGWIDALTQAVASNQAIALLASEHNIGITQTVTGGPEGDVTYHLQVGDGHATFGAGAAEPEDVRFKQDWETATAVATDKLNAQQAFITGRIRLYGDQEKLLANTPVFAALDEVVGAVRMFTEYR